jgi:hypothetical protein
MEKSNIRPTKRQKRLRRLAKWMWLYPPYLGAGISVKYVSPNAQAYKVQLRQRWYNRNIYGTHFGGSLYSMVDPFYVFVAAAYLGDGYILWDKRAHIDFIYPGKGTVSVEVHIPQEQLSRMKKEVDISGKGTYIFTTKVMDSSNRTVATVEKEIYIKKTR